MAQSDKCSIGHCQESAFIYYKGRGICLRHWKEYRGGPGKLQKMLLNNRERKK
jgi:hypothetical protein